MSGNVVAIGPRGVVPGPVDDVVRKLTDLLERAKRGEVRGFVIATVDGGGGTGYVLEQGDVFDVSVLVGSVAAAQYRLMNAWLDHD